MNREQLWNRVDKLLWEEWDPIGVNDYGGPKDEYRSYVSGIVDLINKDEYTIAKHLHQLANNEMGLSSKLDDHLEAASKLKSLE